MPTASRQFSPLQRLGLDTDFRNSLAEFPEEFPTFLKVGTMDKAEVERIAKSNLGVMPERGELEVPLELAPEISAKRNYVSTDFALTVAYSQRSLEDDLYGEIQQASRDLGRASKLTQEFRAAELLDDAFAGTTFTGLQGEPLISNAHTFINALGTWSNRIAGDPTLGVTGLQAAYELGERTFDHEGNPVPIILTDLLINPIDIPIAMQLTENPMQPFTADNDINDNMRRSILTWHTNHFKDTSARDWFAIDKNMSDAWFMWKRRPDLKDEVDFDTQAQKVRASQRFLVYFFGQRGWVASDAA